MSRRILMIEDERGMVVSVGDRLSREGYHFESAADGDTGLRRARSENFDLVLVDVMLPKLGGFEIIRNLRASGLEIPLLLLTARDQVIDRVSGLRVGADDYLVKPFDMDELVARIEAHLRRSNSRQAKLATSSTSNTCADDQDSLAIEGTVPWLDTSKPDYAFGPFVLHYRTASLTKAGNKVALTYQEFRLLCLLVEHQGEVMDGDTLLAQAWGYDSDVSSRTLYVHIAWLRKKLDVVEKPQGFIQTVRRVGYLFVA